MTLQPGTKLGPYEILAPIGAGGMGEVYRATDTRLDRTVAIKAFPAHLADQPELRERFERSGRCEGKWGLYQKPADGTGAEERLVESDLLKVPMAWSPDGQSIVY